MNNRQCSKEMRDRCEKVRSQMFELMKILFTLEGGSFILLPFIRSMGVSRAIIGVVFILTVIALIINFLAYIRFSKETLYPQCDIGNKPEKVSLFFDNTSMGLMGLSAFIWFMGLCVMSYII